jgi:alpha-beta hydrolase superfamily lysophospholipase
MALTVVKDMRTMTESSPTSTGTLDGLACNLWLPGAPRAGVVIIHGAGSAKESHHDYARACAAAGLGALCFDQRGHGQSAGRLDGRMIDDVGVAAGMLRHEIAQAGGPRRAPIALRGSSLGGYLALAGAQRARASAVVAICPANHEALRRGLASGRLDIPVDLEVVDPLLAEHDLAAIVPTLGLPILFMHAEGDEVVPVAHSRELAGLATHPRSRLLVVPGGHHRSIQHDGELQAESLRFLRDALPAAG